MKMKTLVLFSLFLTVALPSPVPDAIPKSILQTENQKPMLGDSLPVQGHVVQEDPLPQIKLEVENKAPEEVKVEVEAEPINEPLRQLESLGGLVNPLEDAIKKLKSVDLPTLSLAGEGEQKVNPDNEVSFVMPEPEIIVQDDKNELDSPTFQNQLLKELGVKMGFLSKTEEDSEPLRQLKSLGGLMNPLEDAIKKLKSEDLPTLSLAGEGAQKVNPDKEVLFQDDKTELDSPMFQNQLLEELGVKMGLLSETSADTPLGSLDNLNGQISMGSKKEDAVNTEPIKKLETEEHQVFIPAPAPIEDQPQVDLESEMLKLLEKTLQNKKAMAGMKQEAPEITIKEEQGE